MGINKTCPKILPFVKIPSKNDLPCVCVWLQKRTDNRRHFYCLFASGVIFYRIFGASSSDGMLNSHQPLVISYWQYNSKSKTRQNGFKMAPEANRQ